MIGRGLRDWLGIAVALLAVGAAGAGPSVGAQEPQIRVVALVPPPALRGGGFVNEPHLALDPANPSVLLAVAQSAPPPPPPPPRSFFVTWRSADAGRTWTPSRLLAGSTGSGWVSADPVLSFGRNGFAALGVQTFDRSGRCTIISRVGSYRSTNGGRSFGAFAAAGPAFRIPRVALDRSAGTLLRCPLPLVRRLTIIDKPWIAVDAGSGSVYLTWSRDEVVLPSGERSTLLFAASRDGGRAYARPLVLAPTTSHGLAHVSQVAVRPDGTVDVVYAGLRNGRPALLHIASRNGGRSFARPEVVTTLPAAVLAVGVVASLAVSPGGALAVCWAGSVHPKKYVPHVACTQSSGDGRWSPALVPFRTGGTEFLPAATFQNETLWVAAYRSTSRSTRVLLARSVGGAPFAAPYVLASRNYGRDGLCAPHPPRCKRGQRFIGDYIGAVASADRVHVTFVLPVGALSSPNRVFVASVAQQ
jgi:hypothetical protein